MRVTQYARRSWVVAGLSLALAACGKDNGPSTFDPQGTSSDMAAAQDAFGAQQTASFAAVGPDISGVLNGSPVVAASAALAIQSPSTASAIYARKLVSLVPRGGRAVQAMVAGISSSIAGTTFVWDESTHAYVASSLLGAPSNGVRFVLYAVDPVMLRPVEPVVEVGYADVIDQSTASTVDIRVKVVQANITYLDYDVTATATASGGLVKISGFVANGSSRADFNLKNTITDSAGGLVLSLDYDISVPSRGLTLNWTATVASLSDTDVAVTLDFSVAGPNGNVRLVGTYGATGGTFTVKVNGDSFATITGSGAGTVITGANGEPLTAEEEASLHTILDFYDASQVAFSELLAPVS
jgi:hypothetical protein